MAAGEQTPHYRVVVAEDNEVLRNLIAQQLTDLGHIVVARAADGVEAVAVTVRERPDVVILDRGLPVQDGLAASRAIAARAPAAVILLSAYLSDVDPDAEAEEAGAHAFLAKPYLIEELSRTLDQAIRRFKAQQRS
jgi:response regulator NasT